MEKSEKQLIVAFVLSFFLGVLGVHRFYVGKVASGLVMLFLTCTIIGIIVTAVWNTIDWITILCGAFRDADGKVLK